MAIHCYVELGIETPGGDSRLSAFGTVLFEDSLFERRCRRQGGHRLGRLAYLSSFTSFLSRNRAHESVKIPNSL